ncbi:unnamed protein product [Prunus armeniaca]
MKKSQHKRLGPTTTPPIGAKNIFTSPGGGSQLLLVYQDQLSLSFFHLSQIFAFLILTLVVRASHVAALPLPPQQVYWNSVLLGTPMPKALSELVQPGSAKNFDRYDKHAEENVHILCNHGAPRQLLKDQYATEDKLLVFYNHGAPKQQLLKGQHAAEDKLLVFYNHGATTAANQLLHDQTQVVFFLEKFGNGGPRGVLVVRRIL